MLKIKKLDDKITYLTIFLQILFVYESFVLELKWSKEFAIFFMMFYSIVLWIYFYFTKKNRIRRKKLIFLLILVILKIISSIVYNDYGADNIVFVVVILTAFLITDSIPFSMYYQQYINVLSFYSIYSLIITYIVHPIIMNTGLFQSLPSYTNTNNITSIDYIFTYVTAFFGFMRNKGPFREAGVFTVFLMLGIIGLLFFDNIIVKNKNKKTMLLILTLLTTVSTSGMISLIFIMFIYFFSRNIRYRNKIIIILVFISSFLLFPQLLDMIQVNVLSRLDSSTDVYQGSTLVRIEGPINCILTNFHFPLSIIIGRSFTSGLIYVKENLNIVSRNDVTGTNLIFLMALGWPMGLYIAVRLFAFFKKNIRGIIKVVLIFISFLFTLNSQAILYNGIMWCIYFYFV